MIRHLVAAVVIMAVVAGYGDAAPAQDAAQPAFLITYIEVAPNSSSEARRLVLAHSVDARNAPGAVQVDALQRIDYPNPFALVEQWQSQAASADLCLDRFRNEISSRARTAAKCRL